MDKQLHLIAGQIVVESTLTNPAKLQFLNWIQKEATEAQVKAFLLDGCITNLDDQAEEIVNARFEAGGRVAKLRKTAARTAGAVGGVNPLWAAYRKIRSTFNSCTRRCGTYEINSSRRQHCMIKCKVEKIQSQFNAAKTAGNEKEALKMKGKLLKVKSSLMKSKGSFAARGAEK